MIMFENVGDKLMGLAKVVFTLGTVAAVLFALSLIGSSLSTGSLGLFFAAIFVGGLAF